MFEEQYCYSIVNVLIVMTSELCIHMNVKSN